MNRFGFVGKIKSNDATTVTLISGPSNDIPGLLQLEQDLKFGSRQKEIKDGEIVFYGELNILRAYHKPIIVKSMADGYKAKLPVFLIRNNPVVKDTKPEVKAEK